MREGLPTVTLMEECHKTTSRSEDTSSTSSVFAFFIVHSGEPRNGQ
jgi:hypothetical protein